MAIFQRTRDVGYAAFFIVHLVAALLLDTQLFLPKEYFPSAVGNFLDSYVQDYKDPLIGNAPIWVVSLLALEVAVQVPYLIVGIFGSLFGSSWMRTPSIIYGTSVVTMCIPMLAHILFEDFKGEKVRPSTPEQRYRLAAIYGGFAFIGLVILLDYALFRGPSPKGKSNNQSNQQKKRN